MKYRSRTDVVEAILRSCAKGPATATMVMYSAYASHKQMGEFVPFLKSENIITVDKEGVISITKKGKEVLHALEVVSKSLPFPAIGKKGVKTKSGNQ